MTEKKQTKPGARMRRRLEMMARVAKEDNSDVDGSYTGTPKDGGEPVQDADDL